MSAPASLAACATARALPWFCRPSVSSTNRLAWPGGAVASPSWSAWARFVPRPPTWAWGRSSLAVARSGWSTIASSPNTTTPAWSPGCMLATDWAANRYALSRAARLTLSDMSMQEGHVEPVGPARDRRLGQREEQHREQRAAQAEGPAVAQPAGQPEAPAGLPAPVEEALQREEQQGQGHEEGPELAHDQHRRRLRPRALHEGGQRLRGQVRLVAVHQVHRHARLAAAGHHRVDADLVGLGEARHPAVDLRPHAAPGRRAHGGGGHPVLDRQQDRLARLELQARLVEPGRVQPAEPLREHEREGDPQREVAAEEIEAEEERLAVALLQGVDQRPAHRLHQRLAGGERPDAHRVLHRHLGEVDLPHDRDASGPSP